MDYQLDEIDRKILSYLSENTRMPFTEIAKKMDVSPGTIHVRMKKIEDAGIVKSSSLVIDYNKLGYTFTAYVGILLTKSIHNKKVLEKLQKIPNITVAHVVSGKYNIFCKIRAKNTDDAKEVIYKIDEIEEVLRTESMISLEESFNDKNRLLQLILKG